MRAELESCWRAAVAAVEPAAAVTRALDAMPLPAVPVHLLALGKAAPAMAGAAVAWLEQRGRAPAGGLIVAPQLSGLAVAPDAGGPGAALRRIHGDHPVPGAGSRRAADALEQAVAAVGHDDAVCVLLSGGTSSLIAAPVLGVSDADLHALWRLLLDSGLDIHEMNAVRRRFTRWGGGRLALALEGRAIEVLTISDVPGDDAAAIGSGPCAPDRHSAADVEVLLRKTGLLDAMPAALRGLLAASAPAVATAPPGHPALARVRTRVVASNADAVRAAAEHARALGWEVRAEREPLTGEAAAAGERIAAELLAIEPGDGTTVCIVRGGETTVPLGRAAAARPNARGGRCQELALAAAAVLGEAVRGTRAAQRGPRAAILAAGTDGRDGPTDAAGAVVDRSTWRRISAAGRNPRDDLAHHDSYAALDAAAALLRSGPTGTNVMDIVIGLRQAQG